MFSGTLTCHQYQIGGSPNSSTPTNQLIEWAVSAEPLHCLTRHSSKHFGVAMPDTSALWGYGTSENQSLAIILPSDLLYMAKFLLEMLLLHVCHWLNLLLTITLLLKGQTEHSILPTASDPSLYPHKSSVRASILGASRVHIGWLCNNNRRDRNVIL